MRLKLLFANQEASFFSVYFNFSIFEYITENQKGGYCSCIWFQQCCNSQKHSSQMANSQFLIKWTFILNPPLQLKMIYEVYWCWPILLMQNYLYSLRQLGIKKWTCSPGKKASKESIQLRTFTVGLCMCTLSSRGGRLMYFIMAL